MRICLVHRDMHRITRGGICAIYRALAQRLAAAGHNVTMLTQTSPHPLRMPGVTVVELPRTDDMASHRRAVTEALLTIAPDVVDCSTWEAETLHYLGLPSDKRAPVVVRGDLSARTMGANELVSAERDLVRRAEWVVGVSAFAARDLTDAYGIDSPQVIANGVDRERFRPGPPSLPRSGYKVALGHHGIIDRTPLPALIAGGTDVPPWVPDPEGRPHLVWVGKITPMKGWDRLQHIAEQLRHIVRITVLLGHSQAFCPIAPDKLGDIVILQDLDETDLAGFYRAADWLLCTSRWEGFGLAIAEALACGTPALLPSDLGTAPELLADGGGATYRDAEHLAEIITAPSRPEARLPALFDWDVNTQSTLALYGDLLIARAVSTP